MLTLDEVQKIARLANLNLSDGELEVCAPQLSEVLDYIKVLDEVDTLKVSPTFQVTGLSNVWREDEVTSSLSQVETLKNAKSAERGFFVSTRVAAGV